MNQKQKQFWLLYGGGVNSTALAVLLLEGELPQYEPFRIVWADTGIEREETYAYIYQHFIPYLENFGKTIEVVKAQRSIFEELLRIGYTFSRQSRYCTSFLKRDPIRRYVAQNGGGIEIIGIDFGEKKRAKPKRNTVYPLVELKIDREGCKKVIAEAGLPVPPKSGCWCCPFLKNEEIISMIRRYPDRIHILKKLEENAFRKRGKHYYNWKDKPIEYWVEKAKQIENKLFNNNKKEVKNETFK